MGRKLRLDAGLRLTSRASSAARVEQRLSAKLLQRPAEGRPVRVGLVGAGKFGSMYMAQIPRTPGVHLLGIADLLPDAARANLARVGWEPQRSAATSLADALKLGSTHVGEDWRALLSHPSVDVVVECTGHPIAAVEHCLAAFAAGRHVVTVTVEAEAFCGPLLARRALRAGVVYSLAFGDQPALICEPVDWARTCGYPVVAAGRGHKGLAHGIKLLRPVKPGQTLSWGDVIVDTATDAYRLRREMEALFAPQQAHDASPMGSPRDRSAKVDT